jgi:hypothetical protein
MEMIKKYRKKPIVVEAMQLTNQSIDEVINFISGIGKGFIRISHVGNKVHLEIPTLEGDVWASEGDYVIKGIAGEFYPCKPGIFEASYEEFNEND